MIAGKIGNRRKAVEQFIQAFLQEPAVGIELEFDEVGDVYHMRGLLCGMLNFFQILTSGGNTRTHSITWFAASCQGLSSAHSKRSACSLSHLLQEQTLYGVINARFI